MGAHDVGFECDRRISVGLAKKVAPRLWLARNREVVLCVSALRPYSQQSGKITGYLMLLLAAPGENPAAGTGSTQREQPPVSGNRELTGKSEISAGNLRTLCEEYCLLVDSRFSGLTTDRP